MLQSLLYVSRSQLDFQEADAEVEKIVQLARSKNKDNAVTGALVFTQTNFAQVIEGCSATIERLMKNILADPRHTNVETVKVEQIEERRFSEWSMAYSGPSFFVDRHIKPLLSNWDDESDRSRRSDRMIALMSEFTAAR